MTGDASGGENQLEIPMYASPEQSLPRSAARQPNHQPMIKGPGRLPQITPLT